MARKRLGISLLDMATVSHNNYGLWVHPKNRKINYRSLSYWRDLARACERARFDTHFTADVLGIAAGFGGNNDTALREGMHVPIIDPFMTISAMAAVTRHLGFAVTASSTYEHPFSLARRFSSLDHFTKGRIGFNVVTSYLPNASENFGVPMDRYGHDEKYDLADEFMEVCYKLWEASWADDAVVCDKENATYAEPSRVRRIDHKGKYFDVAGPHLCEPSPQRTPVIFQAVSSGRGKSFAAQHAEVVFVGGRMIETMRKNIEELRAAATSFGRDPNSFKILAMYSFVTGRTKEVAQSKLDELNRLSSAEGYIAHNSGAGFDLSQFDRSELVADIVARGGPGSEHMKRYPFNPGTTIADIYTQYATIDQGMPFVAGTPEEVADHMQETAEALDLDGYLLRQTTSPETVEDFADYIMPILQKRGIYREEYEGSCLRENIFGAGRQRVEAGHAAFPYKAQLRASEIAAE
jgi:FMN-dependent oxidoreductase (nitrilotriacetate monooxygenase family)